MGFGSVNGEGGDGAGRGRPLLVEAAINEQASKEANPAVPYTPEECAADAVACADAGATIVHLHARDARTGALEVPGTETYREALRLIRRERPELLVYPTYGAAATAEERFVHVDALSDDREAALRVMTVDPGPVNMAKLDPVTGELGPDFGFDVPHAHVRHLLALCERRGVRPTFVVRELGHVRSVVAYHRMGWVRGPVLVRVSLSDEGQWGGPPTAATVGAFKAVVPPDLPVEWMAYTYGPSHWAMNLHALASGDHVRTGLGDNPVEPDGERLTNAEKVRRLVDAAALVGRRPATPAETRRLLGAEAVAAAAPGA